MSEELEGVEDSMVVVVVGGDCSSQGDWVVAASTRAQTLEEGLRRPLPGYLVQREEDGPGGAPRALKTQGIRPSVLTEPVESV